jgi:hypothetical protein
MGLDMYLTAERFLSRFDDNDRAARTAIADTLDNAFGTITEWDGHRVLEPQAVECAAMYWRKANAIHGWFVDHVQGGVDECQPHHVKVRELRELCDLCRHLLAHPADAPEMLPPRSGFFFGSTELDPGYWADVLYTAEGLTRLLAVPGIEEWSFRYRSSW